MSIITPTSSAEAPVITIRPADRRLLPEFGELWRHRALAFRFAWRDVKVRYKQSLIGILWAVLQPLMTMVVFTLILGTLAQAPSEGLDYPVFLYTAMVPWYFFSASLSGCAGSVVSNRQLVQKVYFPRLLLPLSSFLVPLIDFLFAFSVMFGLMLWYHTDIQATAVLAPLFLLLLVITAIGVGAILAVANVRYRDVPYVVPFLIQLWFFLSPVLYPSDALPEKYDVIFALSPPTAAITGFRWAMTGTPPPTTLQLTLGISSAIVLFILGLIVFRRSEPRFADTI